MRNYQVPSEEEEDDDDDHDDHDEHDSELEDDSEPDSDDEDPGELPTYVWSVLPPSMRQRNEKAKKKRERARDEPFYQVFQIYDITYSPLLIPKNLDEVEQDEPTAMYGPRDLEP